MFWYGALSTYEVPTPKEFWMMGIVVIGGDGVGLVRLLLYLLLLVESFQINFLAG